MQQQIPKSRRINLLMNGSGPDYPLYSISEIGKRVYQLALATAAIGFIIFGYYCFLGLYLTAVMVALYCLVISMILFLKHKKVINNTKLPIILFTSISLVIFAAKEGAGTGQYLYFFPIIISIPVIVENHKTYFKKILVYFAISAVCCIICIIVGRNHAPWEPLSVDNQTRLFYTNAISAIVTTIIFAYINISLERKYLEELLAQKNRTIVSRTQFLSTMGHELRTPLNGIIGAINLLKNEMSVPGQQEYFEILQYCSNHMLHQVNDILDFNKIEAGKLEVHPVEVNLMQLVRSSVIPFGNIFEEKNIELKLEIDPQLDTVVLVDDVRLIQVLNNLLSNAGKFTASGYIKLAVKVIGNNKKAFTVHFLVEDTGAGIAESDQQRVFDSFGQVFDESTRKYTGSGLGLTICLQILKLMNSKLELQSTKGVGSKFSFNLNLNYLDQKAIAEKNYHKDKVDLNGIHILLVEDNQINMIIAKKTLIDFKATCSIAYNGQEAIDKLEENHNFHIILMDLEMPIMDGYTAVKEVKKRWPEIPVLAFTATLMDLDMLNKLKAIGFTDCILKPFQPIDLLKQIKKHTTKPLASLN